MNKEDRDNLHFLLTASPVVLQEWYDKVGKDDHEYAKELLNAYNEELIIRSSFLIAEEAVNESTDIFPEANEYLRKFSLGNTK